MHLGVKEQFTRAGPLLSLWVPGKGALSMGELEGKYFMEEERIACPKVQVDYGCHHPGEYERSHEARAREQPGRILKTRWGPAKAAQQAMSGSEAVS